MGRHLSYSNVVATISLFVVLGGTSYALTRINGSQIRNASIPGKKLKRNTLGGARIKESKLGKVPRARRADLLGGLSAEQLRVRCPAGFSPQPNSGVCLELQPRAALAWGTARVQCEGVGGRLPTLQELANADGDFGIALAPGGELTADVVRSADPTSVEIVVLRDRAGPVVEYVRSDAAGARQFRCATYQVN